MRLGFKHTYRHLRHLYLIRSIGMPRWGDDKVAQTLGIAKYGCPTCGYHAIKERDEDLGVGA